MPHFPKVWPNGFKDGITTAQAHQLKKIDDALAKAVNGDDGGLWVPAKLEADTTAWRLYKVSVVSQVTPYTDADGGQNAVYLVDSTSNDHHKFYRDLPTFVSGHRYTISTFAKKNTAVRYLWMANDPGTTQYVFFDLQTGTVGATGGGATGTITSAGGGWYYCSATIPNWTAARTHVGMSTGNGTFAYAGTGFQGILLYKALADFDSGTVKARPIVVGGLGLQPTVAPTKWPTFGEAGGQRVFVRRLGALPASLLPGQALPTSGDFIEGQGLGLMGDRPLLLLDLPEGSYLASVTAYVKIATILRSPLPTNLPKMSVLRTAITTGSELELRAAGASTFVVGGTGIPDAYVSPPASPNVYPTTGGPGAVQKWTYTADQINAVDRTTYFYTIRIHDESGGTAIAGNTYLGFELTFLAPELRIA